MTLKVAPAGCTTTRRDKLWKMRQVRLIQGRNMERILRQWLVADDALESNRRDSLLIAGQPNHAKITS
ncbi:MAG: hypothetical protein EXR27_07160 [Betaproteobacteria bacterium]|nr:hypothetical protein [Betaproteobacteria bacterium]